MSGVILDRLAAAIIADHMRRHGQDARMLPDAIEATPPPGDFRLEHGRGSLRVATGPVAAQASFRRMRFATRDGTELALPALAALMRRDEDGDVALSIREIALSQTVRMHRTGGGGGTPRGEAMIVVEGALPETVMRGVEGTSLSSLIDHPAFREVDARVVGATIVPKSDPWGFALPISGPVTRLEIGRVGKTVIRDEETTTCACR